MDVVNLFQGIAVIFDDEINVPTSTISRIKENIQSKNIPVAVYKEPPRQEIIPSLSNASFVILDWEYTNDELDIGGDERVLKPAVLKQAQDESLILFIRELLRRVFIPVFIFSSYADKVERTLEAEGLWDRNKENRIFIKHKSDIQSEDQLFAVIEEWLKAMPSVYVLKEWEKTLSKSKDAMFLELYGYSPNWAKIIWDMLKEDTIEHQREFGEFVTRSLNNRIGAFTFDEDVINAHEDISPEELQRVVEGERYIAYVRSNELHRNEEDECDLVPQPEQAYTGDLFKCGNNYYLNIRAQCDLSRQADPLLYCIKWKKLQARNIVTDSISDIKLQTDGTLVFSADKCYSLEDMVEICKDKTRLQEFNHNFAKFKNGVFFRKGTFLERNDKVIIGCVAGEKVLQFDLNICIEKYNDVKDKRIGRILPPYITRIQQKCSQNMVREGVMPMPKELFMSFED